MGSNNKNLACRFWGVYSNIIWPFKLCHVAAIANQQQIGKWIARQFNKNMESRYW